MSKEGWRMWNRDEARDEGGELREEGGRKRDEEGGRREGKREER